MAAADPAGPAQVSQQALYHAVADAGSLRYFGAEIEAGNPSDWPGYDAQLRRARDTTGARHAVTTGLATIGGEPCGVVGFGVGFFGGSTGGARGARVLGAVPVGRAGRRPGGFVAASAGAGDVRGYGHAVRVAA